MNTGIRNPAIINAKSGKMGVLSSKGKIHIELYVTLNSFLDKLANEGLPLATRLVQEETVLTTRDDDPDDAVLPPHMRKHQFYARCCYQMGWMMAKKVKSKQHMNGASNLFKDLLMTIVMYRSGPQDQNHRRYSSGRPSSHTGSKSIQILRYKKKVLIHVLIV